MLISVIVITYHRNEFLQSTIASIFKQETIPTPFELIVIDNGGDAEIPPNSPDGIVVRVERPERNLGVAGGRNLGMALARGKYLVFIDDDAIWHDTRDLARFIAGFEADQRCGCIAVRVVNPWTGETDRPMLPSPNKAALANATGPQQTPYYYGCAYAMRADVVAAVGGYPERLMYGMEELDLSLRLIDAEYTIVYHPDIAVLHYTARAGRDFVGDRYWIQQATNKSRVAWRLLPLPYPLTIGAIWSVATLVKTRRPQAVGEIWRTLWRERRLLRAERHVIAPRTVRYLKRVGARLLY